jgi:hypothetical protein
MNVKSIASLIGFAAISAHAFAADNRLPAVAVLHNAQVVVACGGERLPSQSAVGEVLGSNNAAYVYAERERLAHIAHRLCMRGVATVAFVRDASTPIAALAVVETAAAH